jgi:hypothetical protein
MAIGQATYAAQRIAPEKQPDASQARNRVVANIDAEATRAAAHVDMHRNLRKLRGSVAEFTSWWSQNGGATRRLKRRGLEPLANIAADLVRSSSRTRVRDKDIEIARLNGIRHPLHPPQEMSVPKG